MDRQEGSIGYVNSIFEQPWWLDAVSPEKWDEILIEQNGEIVARLPYCFDEKTSKRKIIMPKFTQTLGIWMKEWDAEDEKKQLSIQKEVINEILEQIPSNQSLRIALDPSVQYFLPFVWKGYQVAPRVSYRIELSKGLDSIYGSFDKTVIKNIKSASKKTEICRDTSVETLVNMMEKTFASQGRKYSAPKETIESIVDAAERHGAGKMFTARDKDGNVHACSYFIFDENCCYYLLSGSDMEYRSSGAQSLILWEAMKDLVEVSKNFDFEGSMIEGIETFFRRFGGKPTVYYEIRKQSFIEELKYLMKPYVKKMLGYKC